MPSVVIVELEMNASLIVDLLPCRITFLFYIVIKKGGRHFSCVFITF